MYGLFRRSRSVTSVLFVLVVYMEGDPEPNTMSDHTKAFLDVFQWPEHIKNLPQKQIKREKSFFGYILILGVFLVTCSCSWNRFKFFLVKYSFSLRCEKNNLVNYSYFDSCPRSEELQQDEIELIHVMAGHFRVQGLNIYFIYKNRLQQIWISTGLRLFCAWNQWLGGFLGIITGCDPSVCKSNRLHVDILRFCLNFYIL